MSTRDLDALAEKLDRAACDRQATPQLTDAFPDLGLDEGYAIQRALVARRLARGERVVGIKMGFTSRAKMVQMGVSDLIWGWLTDAMEIADGGDVSLDRFIHPRIEPEIAFRLRTPLSGEVTRAEALAAIGAVAPAMEIIDSRYRDFRFSLVDVVADNSSSSGFVIGPWRAFEDDLASLPITLSFGGSVRQSGAGADILGDPVESLIGAARLAGGAGVTLKAGWIVLAGAATPAERLEAGVTVSAEAGNLGSVSVSVKDKAP